MDIKQRILDKIKEYDRILLFRHIRGDGDCIGATKGLKRIIQLTWPHKDVRIIDGPLPRLLAFLGPDDGPVADEFYADALGIALDTATADRISNPKFSLCKELVKIDHHIPVDPYGDLRWEEPERSSTCEMVMAFYDTFRGELNIDRQAAECLYTGMVTDSGRFRFDSVTGDTLRLAAIALDIGVDTQMLFARLYLEDYAALKFKAHVLEQMALTKNGVAWLHIDAATRQKFGITQEQASAAVDCMDSISGCLCWMVFIDNDDGETIRVRLRSRFAPINALAARYRGGGHANACGATVYSAEEMAALVAAADSLIRDFKANHTDWL